MNEKEFLEFCKLATISSCSCAGLLEYVHSKGLSDEAMDFLKKFLLKIDSKTFADTTKEMIDKAKRHVAERENK